MNKKQVCENSLSIAYYSGFNGLEVKAIFQEKFNIMYVVSNAWDGKKNIINYEYTTTIMVNLFV